MPPPPQKPPLRPGGLGRGLAKVPPEGEDAIARSRRAKDELTTETQALEEELEALKARYEQYFLGVERREPSRWRDEVRKKVMRLKGAFTRNTGLKFRIQSLHARYISYERLWLRSTREKEEGTYRRDLFKARLRAHRDEAEPTEAASPPPKGAPSAEAKAAGERAGAATASKTPPPPRTPAAAPRPIETAGSMSDAQMRALYDAYVTAKRSCNEDVSKLSYEAVSRTVSKQIPELMTRYKAKSVEFRVEVKEGKAILKAVPKV